jgi:phosphoglycolate phosphatase
VAALYSDLDGTMVGPYGCFFRDADTSPTLEPARALVDLLGAGLPLVLVSGRTRSQLEEACRIFGADGYVGEMGAVLGWDAGRHSAVLTGAMPDRFDGTPWQAMHGTGLVDRLLRRYSGRLEYHAPWHTGHEGDVMLRGRVDDAEVERWLASEGFGWLRLHDNGVLPVVEMPGQGGPVHVYHLMPDGLSKGQGVAADLQRRGLRREDAVAVGDSVSDLSMAPHVERFYLVANGAASPATSRAARGHDNVVVCSGANGLGWAEAVRWTLRQV